MYEYLKDVFVNCLFGFGLYTLIKLYQQYGFIVTSVLFVFVFMVGCAFKGIEKLIVYLFKKESKK